MEYQYVPSQCKGEKAKFEGSIKMPMLPRSTQLRYQAECHFMYDSDDKGQVKASSSRESVMHNMLAIAKAYDFAAKHIKDVNLTHKESGKSHTKWAEAVCDRDFDEVTQEAALHLVSGVSLGKN